MRPPGILILPATGNSGYDQPMRSDGNPMLWSISTSEMRDHNQTHYQKLAHAAIVYGDSGIANKGSRIGVL